MSAFFTALMPNHLNNIVSELSPSEPLYKLCLNAIGTRNALYVTVALSAIALSGLAIAKAKKYSKPVLITLATVAGGAIALTCLNANLFLKRVELINLVVKLNLLAKLNLLEMLKKQDPVNQELQRIMRIKV